MNTETASRTQALAEIAKQKEVANLIDYLRLVRNSRSYADQETLADRLDHALQVRLRINND